MERIKERKRKNCFLKNIGISLTILLAAIAVLIVTGGKWTLNTWKHLSMEELIFQLKAPIQGTNNEMYMDFFLKSGIYVIATILVLSFVFIYLQRNKKNFNRIEKIIVLISFTIIIGYGYHICDTLEVKAFIEKRSEYSDFIDENYVDARDVEITAPEHKRNLIYIYLESMETTFADKKSGGKFEKNVIPELTQLANENENFSGDHETLNGGVPIVGATWTCAAMFAQTSGLPLSLPINGNSMDSQKEFIPDIVSLGDILNEEGYTQELVLGSDAMFAGRQLYFEQHGGYKIYDSKYAKQINKIPQDYNEWWGYEDIKMFEYAKEEVLKLAAGPQPFNLTLLTADTHFEDGYVCPYCTNEFGDDQYSNVIACSSRQVNEFVRWIQQQDFYPDTTIVISGDHLTMDSDYYTEYKNMSDRKVYTAYINAPQQAEHGYREYTTFDDFPTTLSSLGFQIEGERLGLGTNLFSGVETLSEKYGFEEENEEVGKRSKLMEKFTDYIKVSPENKK